MRNLFTSKSNVGLIATGVVTLTLAAFLFVMGLIIMDEVYQETSDTLNTVSSNVTLTTVTEAGEQVTNVSECGFLGFAVTVATNATGGETIASGNYTVSSREGKVSTNANTEAGYNNSNWNITYTYYSGGTSESCLAANKTLYGQGKFGDYVDLIVLAVVITVIISLILVAFTLRRVK